MATEFNHGIRIVEAGEDSRPLAIFDQTAVGMFVKSLMLTCKFIPSMHLFFSLRMRWRNRIVFCFISFN